MKEKAGEECFEERRRNYQAKKKRRGQNIKLLFSQGIYYGELKKYDPAFKKKIFLCDYKNDA